MGLGGNGDTVTWRFDVRIDRDPTWRPFDTQHFAGVEDHDMTGLNHLWDCWDDPAEVAVRELDDALEPITREVSGSAVIADLRMRLWIPDEDAKDEPDIVLQASRKQLAVGRLRAATTEVKEAEAELARSRQHLRDRIVAAHAKDRLPPPVIALEAGDGLDEDVTTYLEGYSIIADIRRALPSTWSHHDPWPQVEDYYTHWGRDAVYWCGDLRMSLSAHGEVTLSMNPAAQDYGCTYVDIDSDPEAAEQAAADERSRLAQRAHAGAEVVVAALRQRRFVLYADHGAHAGAADLAASTVQAHRAASGSGGRLGSALALPALGSG
ncbi:hypothetical protein ACFOVU_11505 [Nocardiopsis sediminis]|uniref:Uncharacterized protein n=1 Tax=Nocardiopsis sediminis TaxID=1778267 RepID=A0ABV8FKH6_9ACTN